MEAAGSGDLVGRRAERETLDAALAAARSGHPAAVIVEGEAGVGKTRLVSEHAALATEAGDRVLWARCLRLGAVALPLEPIRAAIGDWLPGAPQGDRQPVLDAVPELVDVLQPTRGDPPTVEELFGVLDQALRAATAAGPTLLVVDDVQWADPATRDLVGYVISGRHRRPLCVLLTLRDEGLADDDPAADWLADLRRLPVVGELRLRRLGEQDTATQLKHVLGQQPDPELVRRVFSSTGGNPYFNELLGRDVDAVTGQLPATTPTALRTALLAGWQRMSEPAREVARLLAVAGRPLSPTVLVASARQAGIVGSVGDAVREATTVGALVAGPEEVWFRHPLLAEVLVDDLLPDEAADRHRALAAVLVDTPDARLADLARHQDGAGLVDEAVATALAAAEEAAAAAAFGEEARLRARAAELCPRLSPEAKARQSSEAVLCADAGFAARRSGDTAISVRMLQRARVVVDEEPDPVRRAGVLRLWGEIVAMENLAGEPLEALAQAVHLAGSDGVELASSLTALADAEWRAGLTGAARRHADQAVAAGRQCGDLFALSRALGIRVVLLVDDDAAEHDAEESWESALTSQRPEAVGLAAIARLNLLDRRGRLLEAAEALAHAHATAVRNGATGIARLLGAYTARYLTEVGRTREADDVLHRLLATAPRGLAGNQARQAAVILAVRLGRLDEADLHIAWLRDVIGDFEDAPGFYGPATAVEHLLARGRSADALELLERLLRAHAATDPVLGDRLLAWGARAAADLAATARHERDDVRATGARTRLSHLVNERAAAGPAYAEDTPVCRAWQAVFELESQRCHGHLEADACLAAAEECGTAAMPHEQARALLHLATVLLGSPATRSSAAPALREAHALAAGVAAEPLAHEIEAVAAAARVPLEEPHDVRVGTVAAIALTPREREVLGHLVAGRTYAEIATALFISEKTVSVHVSNLLRKTGTSSRVEAAAWARREGLLGGPEDRPEIPRS